MSNDVALPGAISDLNRLVRLETAPDELYQSLRRIQYHGVSREDLIVALERIRAVNELAEDSELVEENALTALGIVEGTGDYASLDWSSAEIARIELASVVTRERLQEAAPYAAKPNDLLPPLRPSELPQSAIIDYVDYEYRRVLALANRPQRAALFRVPKSGITSRPAALLAPDDRFALEVLAGYISPVLDSFLAEEVAWPRGRDGAQEGYEKFTRAPEEWSSPYIVVADVENFYEHVDHAALVGTIRAAFRVSRRYLRALEAVLDAVMGRNYGLPQGPPASDVFASVALARVDLNIQGFGWTFVRYADDYIVGAQSVEDGRTKIEELERSLAANGFSLNVTKTKLMKRSKYVRGLDGPAESVKNFRAELREMTERRLIDSEDPEDVERILEGLDVHESVLWDLFYHQSTTIEQVVNELGDSLTPSLTESYATYLTTQALRLQTEEYPSDRNSLERDLKECFVILASARRSVPSAHVRLLLKWFPVLAQEVSFYLTALASSEPDYVRDFVYEWLSPRDDVDWVNAWIANVLRGDSVLVDPRIRSILDALISDYTLGALTRAVALGVVAAYSDVESERWNKSVSNLPGPVILELLFGVLSEPSRYAQLAAAARGESDL